MKQDLIKYLNNTILTQAKSLRYIVKSEAPSTEAQLFNASSLVIWSGASDNTIFQDNAVNWAFRALHDDLHLRTRYNFSPATEIELGRIQASKYSGILADIVYCEVAGQAEFFLKNGIFIQDQVLFTQDYLKGIL